MKKWFVAIICVAVVAAGGLYLASRSGQGAPSSVAASSGAASVSSAPASAVSSVAASSQAVVPFSDALNACLGWGGDAGSSLKSMIAACSVLDWAEDTNAASASGLQDEAAAWLTSLSADDASLFADNWYSVSANGDALAADPASVADLLEAAGNPNRHKSYTAANWQAVKDAVNAALKAQGLAAAE
ncbi:MAG: hypothetical protein LKJ90_09375 [Faecalibacterium sp.]|jgi:hypothetical protein|nr:hypothetical protein [Faecalibacterium sp.]